MKFLIDKIPSGATYCRRSDFLHAFPTGNDTYDINRLLNGIQVVDTRLTVVDLERIENQSFPACLESLFEIKDVQECGGDAEALCAVSIFKMHTDKSTTEKTFEVYLDGLKEKIAYFREWHPFQKLRVYVGNNIWDILHKEKVFEAKNADFIRMECSSEYTEIGTFWRFLAIDDYDYEYVYINETDGHGRFIDGEWQVDIDLGRQKGHAGAPVEVLAKSVESMNFSCHILPTVAPEMREGAVPEDFPLLFWANDYRLSDPLFLHRISEYVQMATPTLVRGPDRLPFTDIRKIFCNHFSKGDERLIYHPESNLWTNIRERHPNLNFRYIDDHWLFHLTKILRVKHTIRTEEFPMLNHQFNKCGDNWFVKRLFDDLIEDDNVFVLIDAEDKGYPFSLSYNERQDYMGASEGVKGRMFFIDEFLDYSNYCTPNKFYHKLTADSSMLPNEVQMIDPRFTEADLEYINGSDYESPLLRLFGVKDKQLSKKQGDALCSTNIWRSYDGWSMQPFSDYLDGLKNRIRHYQEVQPNHKLRVYVGDDVWDILHKEKVLEAKEVDFIRMGCSSQSSIIGLLWRLMAFDDYDYEYVYIDDSDDRTALMPNGKRESITPLLVDNDILKRRMGVPNQNKEVQMAAALSLGAKDKYGNFFMPVDIDTEQFNTPTPIKQIFAPYTYYEGAILTVTRGSKRLPFRSIIPVLCECLNRQTTYFVYHNPTNHWTAFNAVATPLQDTAMDESWLFYMSKLIDIKMWIRPESMSYVEHLFEWYGQNNFFQRIHEQMILEGNHLACGDQGIDEFSFDRFLE